MKPFRVAAVLFIAGWMVGQAAPPPGASPLPVYNGGFDIGGNPYANNWKDPVGTGNFNGGQGSDPRYLSPLNILGGTSSDFAASGALQFLATDHTGEQSGDDTAVIATQMRYESKHVYALSAYAFASASYPGSTFKLQLLANPLPATRLGSTVVAEQVFTALQASDPSGGAVLAPDGVTYWHESTLTFAASNSPSIWGQYMLVQVVGTQLADPGHVTGYPNIDNVGGWFIPEPSAAALILAGMAMWWRRATRNG